MEKNFAVYEKKNFVSVMQTLSANSSRYQKQSETLQIITAFIEYERGFYLGINMRWVWVTGRGWSLRPEGGDGVLGDGGNEPPPHQLVVWGAL